MIARFVTWLRGRHQPPADAYPPFANDERPRPPADLLLEALRRPVARRRAASRPLGAEADKTARETDPTDPLWVRRLDSQIVVLPTLPGSGNRDRRSDG